MAQEYYKWTDDRGVTHYGSQPPAEFIDRATKIKVNSSAPSGADVAESKIQERTQKLSEKAAETPSWNSQKEAAEQKQKEANIENCKIYKKNLLLMTQNNRIREKNEAGEMVILSAEAKEAKMKAAEDYIAEYCQ